VIEREKVRDFYQAALAPLEASGHISLPLANELGCKSALHLYPIEIQDNSGKTRRQVFDSLRLQGIGVNVHYLPIYRHPYYQKLGFTKGYCVNAENYYERAISLPMYANLNVEKLNAIVTALGAALR
jgi:dTDP-4-amino-4,6-dideoxygalactose transaminase